MPYDPHCVGQRSFGTELFISLRHYVAPTPKRWVFSMWSIDAPLLTQIFLQHNDCTEPHCVWYDGLSGTSAGSVSSVTLFG